MVEEHTVSRCEDRVPIYTFAEDAALDKGFLLLASGQEVYVNPYSIVGDLGASNRVFVIERMLGKLGLELKSFDPSMSLLHRKQTQVPIGHVLSAVEGR